MLKKINWEAIATDEDIAKAFGHVTEFFAGFEGQVQEMFKDDNASTDPMIVVKIFEDLINASAGTRPMCTCRDRLRFSGA